MDVSFDPGKDEELRSRRGKEFKEVAMLLTKPHVVRENDGYDSQYQAIG